MPRFTTSTESSGSTSRSMSRSTREKVPLRGYGKPAVDDSPRTKTRNARSGLRAANGSIIGAGGGRSRTNQRRATPRFAARYCPSPTGAVTNIGSAPSGHTRRATISATASSATGVSSVMARKTQDQGARTSRRDRRAGVNGGTGTYHEDPGLHSPRPPTDAPRAPSIDGARGSVHQRDER